MYTIKIETKSGIYGFPAKNYSYHWVMPEHLSKNEIAHNNYGPEPNKDEDYLMIHYNDGEFGLRTIYLTEGRLFVINDKGKTVDMMPCRYWN